MTFNFNDEKQTLAIKSAIEDRDAAAEIERLKADSAALTQAVRHFLFTLNSRAADAAMVARAIDALEQIVQVEGQVTSFCPNCEAMETRNADDRDAAQADAAATRQVLYKLVNSDPEVVQLTDDELREAVESAAPIVRIQARAMLAARLVLTAQNPGAALLAELAQLRTLATAAAGFCAENVGMEVTENGRRLREAVGEWNRATAGDEATPHEYQRNGGDDEC